MFVFGRGSNYFRVDPLSTIMAGPDHNSASRNALAEVKQLAHNAHKTLTDRTLQKVKNRQQGIEVQPWLEKTGWPKYLKELNRQKLMDSVKIPNAKEKSLKLIVWDATGKMLRHSQATAKKKAGYYLRMEVVRSEVHQTRYRSLQAYIDSIQDM